MGLRQAQESKTVRYDFLGGKAVASTESSTNGLDEGQHVKSRPRVLGCWANDGDGDGRGERGMCGTECLVAYGF